MNWLRQTAKAGGKWDRYNKNPAGSGILRNHRQVSCIWLIIKEDLHLVVQLFFLDNSRKSELLELNISRW